MSSSVTHGWFRYVPLSDGERGTYRNQPWVNDDATMYVYCIFFFNLHEMPSENRCFSYVYMFAFEYNGGNGSNQYNNGKKTNISDLVPTTHFNRIIFITHQVCIHPQVKRLESQISVRFWEADIVSFLQFNKVLFWEQNKWKNLTVNSEFLQKNLLFLWNKY